jgi:hypothetical protein
MGVGCGQVKRTFTEGADVVVGTWKDDRIGTFRGTRTGSHSYGGTVFGEKGVASLGPYGGYRPLLVEIAKFFATGQSPVSPEETIEIFTFMEAADVIKKKKGQAVALADVLKKAKSEASKIKIQS